MKTWVQIGVCAVLVALMTTLCLSRSNARHSAPEGFSRHTRGQAFVSQAILAAGAQPWNTWSLSAYQSFVADEQGDAIALEADLPEGGRLALTLHYRPADSTSALVIEAGKAPAGRLLQFDGAGHEMRCTGTLDVVEAGPLAVSMKKRPNGWSASIGTQTMACATSDGWGHPAVTAGLRRVSLSNVSAANGATAGPVRTAILGSVAVGVTWMGILFLMARFSSGIALATAIGSVTAVVLLPIDGARLAEAIRLVESSEDLLPVTVAAIVAALLAAIGWTARWAKTRPLPVALMPCIAFAAGIGQLWSMQSPMGWAYALIMGACLGGLVWVNVRAIEFRHYNLMALALATAVLGSTEVMVRFSSVGAFWNASNTQHGAGSLSTLIDQFEALESGVHAQYPAKGFPVKLPPKRAQRRVACLGASSTGGAFQNDSLDEFYPALLPDMGPGNTEVVNQGVGGWNSFHLRKFLDGHIDSLDSEVWTIYLGVNENLPTAIPFSDLYDAWKEGDLQQGSSSLDRIRLFQGLRLLVRGMNPGAGVGVPAEHLHDNLAHIVGLARDRGIKVLLMSEGVRPDPRILWHYSRVMEQVALSGDDVHYLDTASMLDNVSDHAFIDSNHLTPKGHRMMAKAVGAELTRLGWW